MIHDFKTAQPDEFYKHFLKENIRPDGRELLKFRSTLLNIGSINTASGSALVRLGNTTVVCGITARLAEPSPERPNEGFFVPNVDLPASCSPEYRPGPPAEEAQVLSQFVAETVKSSKLLNMEDFCIAEKKLCWVIYADIHCISHDGNLIDAVMTSLNGALLNTELQKLVWDEETESVVAVENETFHLTLNNLPISTTVAIFNDSVLLVDPTHEEEEISSGKITIVVGVDNVLCSVLKPGGCSIKEEMLKTCIQTAMSRHVEVKSLLDTANETSSPLR